MRTRERLYTLYKELELLECNNSRFSLTYYKVVDF